MTRVIEITTHAINRYQERVKPSITWTTARRELRTLVEYHGRIVPALDWVDTTAPRHVALMELCDGVALALTDKICDKCAGAGVARVAERLVQCANCKGNKTLPVYVATTVLVRGGMDARKLERKRERAARRRRRRQDRRLKPRHDGRGVPDFDLDLELPPT